MLRQMRDGAKSGSLKFILMGAMVLAVAGLVLTDVGGFFSGGGVSNNYVAKGKNIKVSSVQFDQTLRRVLAAQQITPQDAYRFGMVNQVLNSEIQMRILNQEAQRLGLVIGDNTLAKQISTLSEPLVQEGQSKKEALHQVLRAQGISETQFINAIRQEMRSTLFQNALVGGVSQISRKQAKDLYLYKNESRDFVAITLDDTGVKDLPAPTEENLTDFYETLKNNFMIPERRSVTVATLKREMVQGNLKISDEELKEIYEDDIELYRKPEKRNVEQAVLSTEAEAVKTIEKINAGQTIEQAVTDVTGKNTAYLGANNFAESDLLDELADAIFDAQAGDVIEPVESPLGWHVMKLKSIKEAGIEPFDDVKKTLKEDLMQTRLMEELENSANMLDDRLASGEELEAIVADMGLTTEELKDFTMAGIGLNAKNLFTNYGNDQSQILEAAFDLNTGESAPIMELDDGRFVTVRVDNVTEVSYKPYESVKADLKKRWIGDQQRAANKLRAEEAFAKLKGDTDLSSLSKEISIAKKSYNKIIREAEAKAPIDETVKRQIFTAQSNEPIMIKVKDGYMIGEVTNVSLPDETKVTDAQIDSIIEQESVGLQQEIMAQYINAMSERYNVKVNDRLLKSLYGAPVAN